MSQRSKQQFMDQEDLLLKDYQKQSKGHKKEEQKVAKERPDPKVKLIKKKNRHRQITDYFNKVGKSMPRVSQQAVQNRQGQLLVLSLQQQRSWLQLQQVGIRREHASILRESLAQAVKQQIQIELRRISQIDRFFRSQLQIILIQLSMQIQQTQQNIKHLANVVNSPIPSHQLSFISRELQQQTYKLNNLLEQHCHHSHQYQLLQQQQNSILGKQHWPLISKRYVPVELIGKGGFSQVYRGYDLEAGRWVALKLSSVEQLLSGCGDKYSYLRHIKRQFKIHSELEHCNIVKLIEVIQLQNMLCIVLQYCQGPTLAQMMKQWGRVSQKEAKILIKLIANVIWYLSRQKPSVIHYDLKPQNIIFRNGELKVLDFGISKVLDNQHSKMSLTSRGIGTYGYLPPQTLISGQATLSSKVDIWSLGIISYELLCGRHPFESSELANVVSPLVFEGATNLSAEGMLFMSQCLELNQSERLSAGEAANHIFLTQQ